MFDLDDVDLAILMGGGVVAAAFYFHIDGAMGLAQMYMTGIFGIVGLKKFKGGVTSGASPTNGGDKGEIRQTFQAEETV